MIDYDRTRCKGFKFFLTSYIEEKSTELITLLNPAYSYKILYIFFFVNDNTTFCIYFNNLVTLLIQI